MNPISRRIFLQRGALLAGVLGAGSARGATDAEFSAWNQLGWAPGKLAAMRKAIEKGDAGTVSHVQLEASSDGPEDAALEAGVTAALFLLPDLALARSWRYGVEEEGPFAMLVGETADHRRLVVRLNGPEKRIPVTVSGDQGTLVLAGLGNVQLKDRLDRVAKEYVAAPFPDVAMRTLVAAAHTAVTQAGRTARQQRSKQG